MISLRYIGSLPLTIFLVACSTTPYDCNCPAPSIVEPEVETVLTPQANAAEPSLDLAPVASQSCLSQVLDTVCSVDRVPEHLLLVGNAEYIVIEPELLRLKARIDTGATSSSVGVEEFQHYERDGESWIRFVIVNPVSRQRVEFSRPLKRIARIKRHGQASQERPVVELTITLGNANKQIEVNLADRSNFRFPALLGRNYLGGSAVVDASRSYILSAGE